MLINLNNHILLMMNSHLFSLQSPHCHICSTLLTTLQQCLVCVLMSAMSRSTSPLGDNYDVVGWCNLAVYSYHASPSKECYQNSSIISYWWWIVTFCLCNHLTVTFAQLFVRLQSSLFCGRLHILPLSHTHRMQVLVMNVTKTHQPYHIDDE